MTILDTLPSVPWDNPASPTRIADLTQRYRELQRMAKEAGITPYLWTMQPAQPYAALIPLKPGRQVRRKRIWGT